MPVSEGGVSRLSAARREPRRCGWRATSGGEDVAQAGEELDPVFQDVKPVTLPSSLKSITLRLWDESAKKLIGFRHLEDLRKRRDGEDEKQSRPSRTRIGTPGEARAVSDAKEGARRPVTGAPLFRLAARTVGSEPQQQILRVRQGEALASSEVHRLGHQRRPDKGRIQREVEREGRIRSGGRPEFQHAERHAGAGLQHDVAILAEQDLPTRSVTCAGRSAVGWSNSSWIGKARESAASTSGPMSLTSKAGTGPPVSATKSTLWPTWNVPRP